MLKRILLEKLTLCESLLRFPKVVDGALVEAWALALDWCEPEHVAKAFSEWIRKEKDFPVPAEIRNLAVRLVPRSAIEWVPPEPSRLPAFPPKQNSMTIEQRDAIRAKVRPEVLGLMDSITGESKRIGFRKMAPSLPPSAVPTVRDEATNELAKAKIDALRKVDA